MTSTPTSTNGAKPTRVSALVWSIAELLRGDVRPADYGSFVLPFTVLRRIDCVLEEKKSAVVAVAKNINDLDNVNLEQRLGLERAAGSKFYNASALTLTTVLDDPNHVRANLDAYVGGFSPNVRDIFERYRFDARVSRTRREELTLQSP